MKKWMYVVFPGIMLALFLVVYSSHVKEARAREKARLEKVAEMQAAEAKKKAEAEALAQADAQKRQKEQQEAAAKAEAARKAREAAIDKQIADDTAKFQGEADASAKQVAALQIELDRLHKEKDQLSQHDFDLAKQVQLAEVARRNAELEQQRIIAMIAQRADQSAMAQMPPPPPPKKR